MTKEERDKRVAANPRLKRFVDCGDADRASRLLSMAYLLQSIAIAYTDEANDIIRKHGLMQFAIKMYSERLSKAFDTYNRQIDSMITDEDSRQALCKDFEDFEAVCRRYMASRQDREDNCK